MDLPTPNARANLLLPLPIRLVLFLLLGLVIGCYILAVAMVGDSNITILAGVIAIMGFAMVLTRDIEKILLAGVLMEFSFAIDKFFFFRMDIDQIGGFPGLGISATTVLLLSLYILWVARSVGNHTTQQASGLVAVLPSSIYLVAIILSTISSLDQQAVFFEIFIIVQNILLLIYIVSNIKTEQQFHFIMIVLTAITLFHSLLMIFQYFTHFSFEFLTVTSRILIGESYTRVGSTLGHPNTAAGFLTILLLSILGFSFSKIDQYLKSITRIAFIFGCIALIFTFSRGGWVSFATGSFIFVLVAIRKGWIKLHSFILFLVPGIIFFSIFSQSIINRLTQEDTTAINVRVPLNEIALEMIADNPIFGIGANNFGLSVRSYAAELGGIWIDVVHNKYLLVWSETGIVGLLAFLGVLFTAVYTGWRYTQYNKPLSPLAFGITCGILAQMQHMLVDVFNRRPQTQLLWILIGVLFALLLMVHNHDASRNSRSNAPA